MGHPSLKVAEAPTKESLAHWVKLAQSGDHSALEPLIASTQDRLKRFFSFLTPNQQLAEDLCQETYIRALENLKKLKDPENFLGWLLKTGKNLFLDHVRLHKNSKSLPMEHLPETADAEAPHRLGLTLDVVKALDGLPPDDRLVLVLVDSEAHSYQEAAEIMGISEAALRSRVHRARKAFLERYQAK